MRKCTNCGCIEDNHFEIDWYTHGHADEDPTQIQQCGDCAECFDPEYAECSHQFMRYTGKIPCTGPRKCDHCGYVEFTPMGAAGYKLPPMPSEYYRQLGYGGRHA
ncbi:hypothetical protein LCGC14_0919890 [marine sediment metagenome]|uniref:Uncharacterized protein n=1 Tax=marine sediment metagenome TaxID=412755 RepID=A0A0F9NVY6_9ZZZZ